ncbi:MAG: betaine/proline/choline family ABC transporter ATP-binding protein [Mycobacteriales bacterium]
MIELDRVTKRYGDTTVVDELTLEVGVGELCVLVGPSGCGKTTTMKMINRLVEPTSGRIRVDGKDVLGLPVAELRRGIGYVIQHVGLFPHLSIEANVATVPRLLGWDKRRIQGRVAELLDLVGLEHARYARRYPHELSGGQRQRVGVARALAADPPVLLMDEPFGAIDPITRARLQQEFRRLQAELRKTVVFVTHDVDEAVLLGNRIAVLREGGVLEQYDTPAAILARPATAFVAEFVGSDRGLKQLSVTTVERSALETAVVVDAAATLSDARRLLRKADADLAVVIDAGGAPVGALQRADASGRGRVDGHARALPVVEVGSALKDAFAELLQQDHPVLAVVEDGRYVGVLTPGGVHRALRASST